MIHETSGERAFLTIAIIIKAFFFVTKHHWNLYHIPLFQI